MAQAQLPNHHQPYWASHSALGHLPRHEIPDWESVDCQKSLKLVLKWEIQNLLQRLSDAGEETVILTANVSDDTTNILGSHFGEKFALQSDLDLLKHQFLKYCAVHCKKKSKKTYSPSKRKTTQEAGIQKKLRQQFHDIIDHTELPSLDVVNPLRDELHEEKDRSIENVIGSAAISTLTTPIVPLSKLTTSRRKHTPKKIVPSLPVSQSDSESEDNSFSMDTVVKVEVTDNQEDDIYAENNNQMDEDKNDYFDIYKSGDKNEYFDTLKSGNLSDDSSGGLCTNFLTVNEYQNGSCAGKDLVLSTFHKTANKYKDNDIIRNGPFSGLTNNLESDSDISALDGLPGDAASLSDLDSFSYSPSFTALANAYTGLDPDGKMKIQSQSPGSGKKTKQRASNGFKATFKEDPAETVLLDQSKRGVRKYQCPFCELLVRDRHDLKRHLRTHTKEKPYCCDLCGKKFTRKWDQENHIKKHQETLLREAYLAKEAEIQVKQNLDNINRMALKVKLQKEGLEKGFLNTDIARESKKNESDASLLDERENGNLLDSPVKLET